MARIRTVKPEHWSDKKLIEISLSAHLLWIGIWNFSDDRGVIEGDPYLLKSQIFPRRKDIRIEQIEQWIDQLVKARFLVPFTFNDIGYYVSRTFNVHQKIDKPTPSKIPQKVVDEAIKSIRLALREDSSKGSAVEYSIVEVKDDVEEAGKEESTTQQSSSSNIYPYQPPSQANLTGAENFGDITPAEMFLSSDWETCKTRYFSSEYYVQSRELLCANYKIDEELLQDWSDVLIAQQMIRGSMNKTLNDFAKHLPNWLSKQDLTKNPKEILKNEQTGNKPSSQGKSKRGDAKSIFSAISGSNRQGG